MTRFAVKDELLDAQTLRAAGAALLDHPPEIARDGADGHCEAGARVLYHVLTFDWLDRHLTLGR